jgi:hypothetical protein
MLQQHHPDLQIPVTLPCNIMAEYSSLVVPLDHAALLCLDNILNNTSGINYFNILLLSYYFILSGLISTKNDNHSTVTNE